MKVWQSLPARIVDNVSVDELRQAKRANDLGVETCLLIYVTGKIKAAHSAENPQDFAKGVRKDMCFQCLFCCFAWVSVVAFSFYLFFVCFVVLRARAARRFLRPSNQVSSSRSAWRRLSRRSSPDPSRRTMQTQLPQNLNMHRLHLRIVLLHPLLPLHHNLNGLYLFASGARQPNVPGSSEARACVQ